MQFTLWWEFLFVFHFNIFPFSFPTPQDSRVQACNNMSTWQILHFSVTCCCNVHELVMTRERGQAVPCTAAEQLLSVGGFDWPAVSSAAAAAHDLSDEEAEV